MTKHFIYTLTMVLSLALTIVLTGCTTGGGKVSDDEIAVSWADTSMTVADFKDKMLVRFSTESRAKKKPLEERFQILNEYVVRALKIAEGYRLGFAQREDIRKNYNDALDRTASEKLYNQKVRDSFITDEMIKDFWEHDRYEVRCRHILVEMNEDVKGRDTLSYLKRINEVYEKAKAGERFEKLVRKYSDDKSIESSMYGDLGFFKWGKMVDEFEEAAWKLEPDEISAPVRTRYGYHIIKMLEKRSRGLEVNTSHIMVKLNRRAAPAETTAAWERASMILEEAKKPGADFSELARRYSEDKKTWVNGIVGWIPRGSMPSDYWEKALAMKIGEIDGPVKSYKGYHIIKVNDTRIKEDSLDDPEVLESVKSSIARVYRDSINARSENYLASVKERFTMKYNRDVVRLLLRKLGDKNIPQNINIFGTLKPDERELLVVNDNMGGLKVQKLVDQYGDHRFPMEFEDSEEWIESLVEPILLPLYLSEIAKEEGFLDDPEVLADGKKAIENAMLPSVEQEMVFNKATPTEEEVKNHYKNNIKEFTEAPTATIYEIMVDDKQLADDLKARIDKGEKISKLAKRYTQREKAKRKNGKLGPFTKDQYGPVSRKAFELERGEITEPVKAGKLYSIIQLIETTPENVKTLDDVRRQIESNIRFERQKELKNVWVDELKKYYNVQVNESVIKRVWPIIEPLPEALEAERKVWQNERKEAGKRAARRAKEDQIKVKLQPGTVQEFTTKDGKQVKLKIGEPRYVDKEGKEIDASKSNIKLTPKGKLEKKGEQSDTKNKAPKISIKPKKGSGK